MILANYYCQEVMFFFMFLHRFTKHRKKMLPYMYPSTKDSTIK